MSPVDSLPPTLYIPRTMVFTLGHHYVHLHSLTGWGVSRVSA